MIYCPTDLSEAAERDLEAALEEDEARVHYTGSDGAAEYVIVESGSFIHTKRVEQQHGLKLAWQDATLPDAAPDRPEALAELAAALAGKRRKRRTR